LLFYQNERLGRMTSSEKEKGGKGGDKSDFSLSSKHSIIF